MWRRHKIPVVLLLLSVCFAFSKPAEKYFEIARSIDIFVTLFKEVNAYYVDEIDPEKLIHTGIEGMLSSLDPYTNYIPEHELESFKITTTGQYAGVGAMIGIVNDKAVITHPYKNYPANNSGVKVGDEIIAVDGKNIQGKSTSEISAWLKGQPDTEVTVRVKRYNHKDDLIFKIKRQKIHVRNVTYSGLITADIGYIKLDDFTPGASREVFEALDDLKNKGAKKLIFDLRNNSGGLLHEAVNIVGLFISKGKEVVSTLGKAKEWNKHYKTLNAPADTAIPMVVLINESSASAAEIVAGALQDYDRAVLIGEKTFGKGLVQTTRALSYNAQLKVTTARYYTPSGRCIQAIDCSHRKEDGSVEKFADSLKREFKTVSGRKVYDGGGLDPDVKTSRDLSASVTSDLLNSGLVFEYASKYCSENPTQPDFKAFRLSDQEYEKFILWIKEQGFTYTSPLEKDANKLVEIALKNKQHTLIREDLTHLQHTINSFKAQDYIKYKEEISIALEDQIAFHYALHEGQVQVSLHRDKEILEAEKIFLDLNLYNAILSPSNGTHP